MNLFTQILIQIGGGVGAAVLDRQFADKSIQVGPAVVTPGAMAVGVGAALALSGALPASAAAVLGNLVGGGLVYEGTKIGEQQVIPLVERFFPANGAAAQLPVGGEDYVAGNFLGTGLPDSDGYSLQSSLQAFRGF